MIDYTTIACLPRLELCLQESSWRHLLAMMHCQRLVCSTRWSKKELVQRLTTYWQEHEYMGLVLDGLPVAVQKGLRAMVLSGGRLPMRVFVQRYGGLRSYRPWRQDGGNFVPWEDALSVGEHLWFSGLVYLWPPGATPREASEVVMAAELWERVAEWGMPQGELAGGEWPRPSGSPDLLWDVVLLLATAVEEDVGVHKRPLAAAAHFETVGATDETGRPARFCVKPE